VNEAPEPTGIEWRAIATLRPSARNSRTHTEAQVAEIAASMREWGWTMPALIDEADEIIAGHGRVRAADLIYASGGRIKMAGGAEIPDRMVPVIVARGWTDNQKRAYIIADNRIGENAGWDDAMLRIELSELQEQGLDLGLLDFDLASLRELSVGIDSLDNMPVLNDGDRSPFREMTFILLASQADTVAEAVRVAGQLVGPITERHANQNINGNALAEICRAYLDRLAASISDD
jgi:ParB-like nuclease family protein